jgi:7-cyano-7-deazaguanine synthase
MTGTVLLLSGGIDSAAVACWTTPDACLFIDYGQLPAPAERLASERIAHELARSWFELSIDCRAIGSGLLAADAALGAAPAAEWWPFRNQLLATLASAWAIAHGYSEVAFGTVLEDASRFADGSPRFFTTLDALTSLQEGGIRIATPARDLTSEALIAASGVQRAVLGLTFSCHRSTAGCGACPGCAKRTAIFDWLARVEADQLRVKPRPRGPGSSEAPMGTPTRSDRPRSSAGSAGTISDQYSTPADQGPQVAPDGGDAPLR